MDFHFKLNTLWVVENVLWISSGQDNVKDYQCFFHNTIDFQNIIHINFYIVKSKNTIYCAHTSVDPGLSTMGDVSCRHPNHSSRSNISQTASVEWIIVVNVPFCPGYFFILIFIGPWARLCQSSSLGLEPILLCCLFILSSL